MICEWVGRGGKSSISKFFGVEKSTIPFFTGRPYTISSDAILPENFQSYFLSYDIGAGVFLPLLVNDKLGMYVCFTMGATPKKWSVDDVKLLNDVKVVLQTILVKRVTKNSLASSYAALDAILENAGCGICVHDAKAKTILYTNETFHEIFDNIQDRQDFEKTILSGNTDTSENINEYFTQGSKKWYQISFSQIHWVDGREVCLSTIYDITDVKKYQKQIEEQAMTDYLTGLYNRMQFEVDLKAAIRDAVRSGDQGTFLYLDLDDFKDVNDGLGHNEGDEFLQKTAIALQTICRGKATCYRLGGDEFAVIIPATSRDFAESIIGTIQRRFGELWNLGDAEYFCTACMGVVCFPKDGTKVDVLMQRADIAMYGAKQNGKNKVEYYSKTNDKETVHRLDMERAMRQAVAAGCEEFEVYYQPLVDASNMSHPCCGAEALVRWNSKDLGMLLPNDFIPLAEYLGLIVPIGNHVLLEACKRCKFWNDFGQPEYSVNVNLSLIQLLQGNIVETVQDALISTGLFAQNLTLEVTESLASSDAEKIQKTLEELRELGVRLALDDFGTGYSSLGRLKDLPVDILKIDKCFVNEMGKDEFSDAFIQSVSSLADSIHVDVVVEGVEEEAQQDAIRNMKVDMVQGYLYDKPLSREEFEEKYLNV
ncbi:MAG: EAL domain-containing protein [Lachnospiraceae bacterium]|nr:EAL domain-containing protein [Lachnospiraceae bacterium]